MKKEKPLPCPFCGHKVEGPYDVLLGGKATYCCSNPSCCAYYLDATLKEWNRRPREEKK